MIEKSAALLMVSLVSFVAGCQQADPRSTAMICRGDAGCAEEPKNVASYDPDQAMPDRDPDGRGAALEELAAADPGAAYDLALRMFRGDGVPRDSYVALQWMRSAAERGSVPAQLALGRLYMTGLEEMGSDLAEAEVWLGLAAGAGNAEAKELHAAVVRARADDTYLQSQLPIWRPLTYRGWTYGWRYRWMWDPQRRLWHY